MNSSHLHANVVPESQKIVGKGFGEGFCNLVGWLVIAFDVPPIHTCCNVVGELEWLVWLEQVGGGSMCFLSSLHS